MRSPQETDLCTDDVHAPATPPVKKQPTYWELGIVTEKAKKPDLATKEARLNTFAKWPPGHFLKVDDLADAGFYHAGYGDCARCFSCGGGLKNWDDGDNVLVEHARWFPKCGYIRQLVGQAFIETVLELNKREVSIPYSRVIEAMGERAQLYKLDPSVSSLKQDPAVQTLVYLGFDEDLVLETAKELKSEGNNISSDLILQRLEKTKELDFCNAVMSNDCTRHTRDQGCTRHTHDQGCTRHTHDEGYTRHTRDQGYTRHTHDQGCTRHTHDQGYTRHTQDQGYTRHTHDQGEAEEQKIKEENQQLRQQTLCKICLDNDVAVVFLPCGHLVSCLDCSLTLKSCPICRTHIKGAVRAFIG